MADVIFKIVEKILTDGSVVYNVHIRNPYAENSDIILNLTDYNAATKFVEELAKLVDKLTVNSAVVEY